MIPHGLNTFSRRRQQTATEADAKADTEADAKADAMGMSKADAKTDV